MVCKKETRDKCLISLSNHIGIETGNRKESESISRIGIEIDKIQTIPNPNAVQGDWCWSVGQCVCVCVCGVRGSEFNGAWGKREERGELSFLTA